MVRVNAISDLKRFLHYRKFFFISNRSNDNSVTSNAMNEMLVANTLMLAKWESLLFFSYPHLGRINVIGCGSDAEDKLDFQLKSRLKKKKLVNEKRVMVPCFQVDYHNWM